MTVSSLINRNDYDADGTTATYAYTFRIFVKENIKVIIHDNVLLIPDVTLTYGTDYTLTGIGQGSGGTVVLVNGTGLLVGGFLPVGKHITIRRVLTLTQLLDIKNQGSYFPESIENAFDYLTMLAQQLSDDVARAIKEAETQSAPVGGLTFPSILARANMLLGFDSDGAPVAVAAGGALSGSWQTLIDAGNYVGARALIGFPLGYVTDSNIVSTGLGTASIADDAITTAKILASNVTRAKLAEAARLGIAIGASSTGGSDAYAVTSSPAFTAYAAGMFVIFNATVANTGAATLQVDSLAAKALKTNAGTALVTGDILANDMVLAVYDTTGDCFRCMNIGTRASHSEVMVHSGNNNGATSNKIRLFTTTLVNTGSAITVNHNANTGTTFTINETGLYAMSYWDGSAGAILRMGISNNASSLTTSIDSITVATRLVMTTAADTDFASCSITAFLTAGDIIRPHNTAAGSLLGTDQVGFRIVKVG